MAMVVARWRREGDGGGSEGDGGGGLGNEAGGDNDGRVGEGDGGGGLGEGSVGEGEGGACGCEASEQSLSVPSPQHRDFRDQHDEPRRFCAGAAFPAAFARAPPAVEWISCAVRRQSASPAQRKKKMSCAHEAHVSTRAARR